MQNRQLLLSTVVAALGGFLFGFDTAVISGITTSLREVFQLSSGWLGFAVASALIGTLVGALASGGPADRFGRKATLLVLALFYVVSALGSALCWDLASFVFFRFVGGVAVGGASVVSPMYISEISPPKYRGRLVAVNQLNIVVGILAAYFSNYGIGVAMSETGVLLPGAWRWMLGAEALPAALFLGLLFLIPQSPRWLMTLAREEAAEKVLERLGYPNAKATVEEIRLSLAREYTVQKEPLFQKRYQFPLFLAFMLATFQQLSGINALIYYTADIFKMAGAGATSALGQSVIIGITNLVFTLAAMSIIDHFGRRKLLLIGCVGMAVSLVSVGFGFMGVGDGKLVLWGLVSFIASFAFSSGAVMWVYVSEIFPNRVRAKGQSFASFTHWFWCAAVSWTFPVIADTSGAYAFLFYAVMMVFQFVLVWKYLPETKGESLEKIQVQMGIA